MKKNESGRFSLYNLVLPSVVTPTKRQQLQLSWHQEETGFEPDEWVGVVFGQ